MSGIDAQIKKSTGYALTPQVNRNSGSTIGLALMTAIGAFGGFPQPPRQFNEMVRDETFQYLMLWVLIYQGGGSQDPKLTTLTTVLVYAMVQMMKN